MIISFLYEIALGLMALLALPKFLYSLLFQKKYRSNFLPRLGYGFPEIVKNGRQLVWIHAVSVGEVKAVSLLAKQLKAAAIPPLLLVSTITETGRAEVTRAIPQADFALFLPFDFRWIMKPLLHKVKPDFVLLTETDFWYNFLRFAKSEGAKIALVNGKISSRSASRFSRFPSFSHRLFAPVDLFCVQNQLYAERFHALGVSNDKIVVTGNIKFDGKPNDLSETEKQALRARLGILPKDKVVVIGSTHDLEEKQLLEALLPLWDKIPALKVIVVPRHPERFAAVKEWLATFPIPFGLYSDENSLQAHCGIVLIDAMGMLGKSYQIADAAIVAGSYTEKVGGHNILEPIWHRVPTIFGPYMFGQPDLLQAVLSYKAGEQLPVEQILDRLISLLQQQKEIDAVHEASQNLISAMQGSTERTVDALATIWKF